ncbi:MAG: DUF2062 domain-containing protein [Desulfobacteraceae bacterium]|jgi:uncharacterized protein (DUF2062 family)|nr:DUF2062 domain-containing protein [Desulfobacteraceae bacterium]
MNDNSELDQKKSPLRAKIESKIKNWIQRTRALNGEPRYVAMGMAVGIFVSATPTIPFQTMIAVPLAFLLRGSKAAAAIGVWLSNPLTFPFFYLASYKTGAFLFGISNVPSIAGQTRPDLLKLGFDTTLAALAGGIIIGSILAIGAYFITRKIVTKIRKREKKSLVSLHKKQKTRLHLAASPWQAENPSSPDGFVTAPAESAAPATITTPTDPTCDYSRAMIGQSETKDQRPRN